MKDALPQTLEHAQRWQEAIGRMARVSEVAPLLGDIPHGSAQAVVDEATLIIPLAGLIDLDAERARLKKNWAKRKMKLPKPKRNLATKTLSRALNRKWCRKCGSAWKHSRVNVCV